MTKAERPFTSRVCAGERCVETLFSNDLRLIQVTDPYDPSKEVAALNITSGTVVIKPRSLVEESKKEGERIMQEKMLDQDLGLVNDQLIPPSTPRPKSGGCSSCAKKKAEARRATEEERAAIVKSDNVALTHKFVSYKDPKPMEGRKEGIIEKGRKTGLMRKLAKGVPGLLKSELGLDRADQETMDKRQAICEKCPDGIYDFGVCSEERGGCGCFLASKVTINGESCPKGHW